MNETTPTKARRRRTASEMYPVILGKKVGMTQVYDGEGRLHPVTVVQAGPCTVLQIKQTEPDGYNAVQLGFDDVRPHRATKPQIGHATGAGTSAKKFIREVRVEEVPDDVELGGIVTVDAFEDVAFVDVIGTTKGKGFAGVMKRHGFKGLEASHGVERKHRSAGSIGGHANNAGTGPTIKKGKRMAGHMGSVKCTTRNHKLIGIDKEENLLLIKGALPGAAGGYLYIRRSLTAKASKQSHTG